MGTCHAFQPISRLSGVMSLPASKSYSIRAFIISGCGGVSTISSPSLCDDAVVARKVIQQLGARVTRSTDHSWKVEAENHTRRLVKNINVNESGTVLRFLLPLVSALGKEVTIDGCGTLRGRPNGHLTQTLRQMGASIRGHGAAESVPVVYQGGRLVGGTMQIEGSLSSQFISALMITCPLLEKDTRLKLTGRKLVSGDYVIMTRKILELAGIQIVERSPREYFIPGGQVYAGLKRFHVPSDYGLAAFPLAAAALLSSRVTLKGFFQDALPQADAHIMNFFKRLGVDIIRTKGSMRVQGPFVLKGGEFSLKACPDLVPIMSVLAMFAKGRTVLKDIEHARAKESDRISDLRQELLKVGADIRETRGSLKIYPRSDYQKGMTLDPHHDHRLAMAFAVLGMKIGVNVKDMGCVAKSYPDFLRDIRLLGARVKVVAVRKNIN